jgi:DNA (cytosine-5)-methyltransferase 1
MTILRRPTSVDLFCGVGGMSLGFEQAGFEVIAAIDIEQIHVDTYLQNFPSCQVRCLDLSAVSGAAIRKETGICGAHVDVVFAGSPCQGFSLIGKRLLEDPRNLLLYDLARLITELMPSYFVVENVGGILLGDARKVLDEFIARLERNGYRVVKPIQVLDASDFGVPQRRRRVFLLGSREGLAPPKYPKALHPNGNGQGVERPNVWDAISDLPEVDEYDYLLQTDEYRGVLGQASAYARVLRGETRDGTDNSTQRRRNGHGLGGCLRTVHTPETIKRFKATEPGGVELVSRYHRLSKDGLSPTIRAGTGPAQGSFMAPRPIHPVRDRCITVREAARLHSFPDWFTFHPTKWHGFRQIGNSVPPFLARSVAKSVIQAMLECVGPQLHPRGKR